MPIKLTEGSKLKVLFIPFRVFCVIAIALFPVYSLGASVDLRTSSDVSGEYEIGFCARPSQDAVKRLPGHAFVSFSFRTPDGKRTFTSIGHTVQLGVPPTTAAWSYFGDSVSGYLAEEKYTSAMESCLVAKVNRAEYDKGFALTKNPLASMGVVPTDVAVLQAYKLGADDCVSFMISVANVLVPRGLKVPQRGATELPLQYMQRFIASN